VTATTDAAWWAGQPEATPEKRFSGYTRRSLHVPTRDGTRIAVDVYLPAGLPQHEQVPTILVPTPYFRSMQFRHPLFEKLVAKLSIVGGAEFAGEITQYGYANVVMEVRGAGASFGTKTASTFGDTVTDGADVLDWIAAQPWSNGNVGATGISGPGMLSQWMTTAKHPALKAIAPRFTSFDMFASTHPGGLTLGRFLVDIGSMLRAMDANRLADMSESPVARTVLRLMIKGLQPVDGPDGQRLLDEAVREHEANEHVDEQLIRVAHRDELLADASIETTLDEISPFAHATDMEASGAAIYAWAGWFDAAFATDMLSLHNTVRAPGSRIVIGPWAHGGRWQSSPVVSGAKQATDFDHVAEMVRFFDLHLRDRDLAISNEAPIHYFTMGEERWKSAEKWPLANTTVRPFFFAPGGALDVHAPAAPGADDHAVDFSAGTGVHSRFGKHMTGGRFPVRYPKRAEADARLLTYTSAALDADLEVTGDPLVRLFVESTAPDAALLVYLEDVDPSGEVRCVTDGCLRASARATAEAPYWMAGPFHRYAMADPQPLVPGEVAEIAFSLYPVSWLFRAGHCIRVAISGADKDNFVPVAEGLSPRLRLHRGASRASAIELPTIPA
jgi:putative CocE/NonD family hydrolase